mgnify:CR=1 FL=1
MPWPMNSRTMPTAPTSCSVLAKVTRDRLMEEYHERWPVYGFAGHKGYGAPAHIAALKTLGPCPEHRMSWAPIKALLDEQL